MSPPDPLCHWGTRARQQHLCLSCGDPKLPCTQRPIPGCRMGWAARGSSVSNTASTFLPVPCRGVGFPHPRNGHLAAPPAGHASALASRCCGHPWGPQTAHLLCCTAGVPYAYFLVTILRHTVHLSGFYFCTVLCS